jgi:uncharacterized protein (DUF58 family)
MLDRLTNWLEHHWVTPAFGGWLLAILSMCFFGAASNTMAGWLYVLSGIGIALLGVGAVLPARSIRSLSVSRARILPVTAGTDLEIALTIHNPSARIQTLFQVSDLTTLNRSQPPKTTVERILPQHDYVWTYYQPTTWRGVYEWENIAFRSGAPIGLFWCQRSRQAPATAYVYPQVLKLDRCPLIDAMGNSERQIDRQSANRRLEAANEGVTRSLRPYRYGDPMRAIHWRTSARYGIFQVRELEIDRSGQDLVVCLDSGANWDANDFEQAVIAACSLYFYALQSARLNVQLWTTATGLVSGDRQVLETLAAVQMNQTDRQEIPALPKVLLTSQPRQVAAISPRDRWLLWTPDRFTSPVSGALGIKIDPDRGLQQQLCNANFASKPDLPTNIESPVANQNPQFN